jgi:hypothetical protein
MKKISLLFIFLSLTMFSFPAFSNDEPEKYQNKIGIGLELDYNMVPQSFLKVFLQGAHDVKSTAVGARFIIRKKHVDIIFKGAMWKVNPPNGVWSTNGEDWADTDYMEFENITYYYGQVSFMWNYQLFSGPLTKLFFTYGGGVGAGYVDGKVYSTPTSGTCTSSNYQDATIGGATNGCWAPSGLSVEEDMDNWRIMGALELSMGLRLDITEMLSIKGEVGLFLPGLIHGTLAVEFYF